MTWVGVIGTVLQIVLMLLKEWGAKKNGAEAKIDEIQKKRLALLDAIADGRSDWISDVSYRRAHRLRLILGVHQEGQPSGRGQDLQPRTSDVPSRGNSDRS